MITSHSRLNTEASLILKKYLILFSRAVVSSSKFFALLQE